MPKFRVTPVDTSQEPYTITADRMKVDTKSSRIVFSTDGKGDVAVVYNASVMTEDSE
jgi:hypothetical protein